MEGDAEFSADQIGDPAGRPKVGGEAVGGRLLGQPSANFRVLIFGEESGPARRGVGGQARFACGAVLGHPLGDGNGVHAQCNRHRGLRLAGHNELGRPASQRFQSGSRSFASHRRGVDNPSERINSFTYLRISSLAGAGTIFSLAIVFVLKEFESILIAAADQLPDIVENYQLPPAIGSIRDAKGWLDNHLTGGYDPVRDQNKLTKAVKDWDAVRSKHRSFRRFENALLQIVSAVASGGHIVSPVSAPVVPTVNGHAT